MSHVGNVVGVLLRLLVRAYQFTLSPVMAPSCRFAPNCSDYALQALERFGPARGIWMAMHRIVRCNPWGGQGLDPVPEKTESEQGGAR